MPLTNEQYQVILNSLMKQCGCPAMIEDRLDAFKAGMAAAVNGVRGQITLDDGAIKKPVRNSGSAASAKRSKAKRK